LGRIGGKRDISNHQLIPPIGVLANCGCVTNVSRRQRDILDNRAAGQLVKPDPVGRGTDDGPSIYVKSQRACESLESDDVPIVRRRRRNAGSDQRNDVIVL
jgi:hypothetical protein